MALICDDELRRNAVARHAVLNGIDAIEVLDTAGPPQSPRQQTLLVRCLKPIGNLTRANVAIEGGARVKRVTVVWAARADAVSATDASAPDRQWYNQLAQPDRILVVRTDEPGDFSRYELRLVDPAQASFPAPSFDPVLARAPFSFKVECPNEFDCASPVSCAREPGETPDIDYLSKDFAGYRRLILDRLSHLLPDWQDRNPADLGVVLAELLAYVGDQLSYEQDAIATEAYLRTARRRSSVRRHTRLVDYYLHDGCNARAWVIVDVALPRVDIASTAIRFATQVPDVPPGPLAPDNAPLNDALESGRVEVFEPMHDMTFYGAHSLLPFYTWSDRNCCLPRGTTRATLAGHFPDLKAGDVLVIEELVGPQTHLAYDADLTHRHAVRLTSVTANAGAATLTDPLTGDEITEIAWHPDDALPFAVAVSSVSDPDHGEQYLDRISVARGNVVAVDHGRSMRLEEAVEDLGVVRGDPRRYRPRLQRGPITQAAAFAPLAPARTALITRVASATPAIELHSTPGDEVWVCRRDLLDSKAADPHFVLETEDDGTARIRFGDNINGNRPEAGLSFRARYRLGNGLAGNVGAEAIAHAITTDGAVQTVRNPIPASGGTAPQPIEEARRRAPHAFRTQERAVTADDYARRTEEHGDVQRASSRLRWTGSWYTVFTAVDRIGGLPLTDAFEDDLQTWVDRFRMAGQDLEFDQARFIPLEVEMSVCTEPGFRTSDVAAALLSALTPLFDADRLTFGQTVYLSPIYSVAHRVPGVQAVRINTFQRLGDANQTALDEGELRFGALEIPQLDNDPNFPDRGVLRVIVTNGR